ncbi:phage portal protein [Falsigemmobacter intermedius]|uniref:phage portal protein n=1 Tax=Falsigemmobacter intermedius TaxID=1553448 RepID=UPI003F00F59C
MFGFRRRKAPPDTACPEVKASAAGRVAARAAGSGRVVWSPRDTGSLIRNGYMSNPVVFRAIRMIAESAGNLPLILQDEGQRYETHPILALLDRPNAFQGRAEFLEAVCGHLLLSGNAWVEAVCDPHSGEVRELYALRPERMSLVPGEDGWPVACDYNVGGRSHRFDLSADVKPVCHIRAFHPLDDHYGYSALGAAAVAMDVHGAASRWSKALLDNAARPSGAIIYRGADGNGVLTAEQYDRLTGEIESHHMGARNAGRPMLLEGGLDWKPMGFSPSDMEFHQTREAAARDIAMAFGVPPMLLGIPGDATYANYQEANRAFFRLTVLPLATRVLSELAQFLSSHSGAAVSLRPDLDQVPALSAERDAQWARVSAAEFLTLAEKRAALGLPPLPDGG